jgi:hypothetical protein
MDEWTDLIVMIDLSRAPRASGMMNIGDDEIWLVRQ